LAIAADAALADDPLLLFVANGLKAAERLLNGSTAGEAPGTLAGDELLSASKNGFGVPAAAGVAGAGEALDGTAGIDDVNTFECTATCVSAGDPIVGVSAGLTLLPPGDGTNGIDANGLSPNAMNPCDAPLGTALMGEAPATCCCARN